MSVLQSANGTSSFRGKPFYKAPAAASCILEPVAIHTPVLPLNRHYESKRRFSQLFNSSPTLYTVLLVIEKQNRLALHVSSELLRNYEIHPFHKQ